MEWRALLDSNQWPSASELAQPVSTTLTETPQPSSNGTVSAKPGSQRTTLLPRDREDFVTWLLPRERVPSLLTVREVAAQLRACTATVYPLCDEGQLRHIRMLHAIRVDPIDLAAFIDARRSRRQ
jgi:hypothetical protein